MRVFIYCRVSTDEQEDNTSLEQQEIDSYQYAAENGHEIVDMFREVYSGYTWRERKEFMKMRARYLAGEVNAVVVRTYSRFTRAIADYFILTQEMKEHNVKLLCVKEQQDDTPLGRTLQALQMGFNEQERETTRQRTIDGKKLKVAVRGEYLASSKPPYGYAFDDPVKKSKLVKNEKEAETVEWVFEERAKGATFGRLAMTLNEKGVPSPYGKLWSEMAIRRILDNGQYLYRGVGTAFKVTGVKEYHAGKLVHVVKKNEISDLVFLPDGTVERIISDDLAAKVAEVTEINKRDNPRANCDPEATLLRSGFVRCGLCGFGMSVDKRPYQKNAVYSCPTSKRTEKKCATQTTVIAPWLDEKVWDYTVGIAKTLTVFETAVNAVLKENNFATALQSTVSCIADCDTVLAQYRQDLKRKDWKPATRAALLEDLETQIELKERLESELEKIQHGQISYEQLKEDPEAVVDWCKRLQMGENTVLTWAQKRSHMHALGIQVFVYPKKDETHERYEIRLAPKGLMDVLNRQLSNAGLHQCNGGRANAILGEAKEQQC